MHKNCTIEIPLKLKIKFKLNMNNFLIFAQVIKNNKFKKKFNQ